MEVDKAEIEVKYSYYDKFYAGVKDVANVRVRVAKYVSRRGACQLLVLIDVVRYPLDQQSGCCTTWPL
jgi:hypothetical protein